MDKFWLWATDNWFCVFVLMWIALYLSANLISRLFRMIMVLFRGWPSNPMMDADGDIVLIKKTTDAK